MQSSRITGSSTRNCAGPQQPVGVFVGSYLPTKSVGGVQGPEARACVKALWQPVLELTHNHGTENDKEFKYHNGNDSPQGFGHIGFLCDDLEKACLELEGAGIPFKKRPQVPYFSNSASCCCLCKILSYCVDFLIYNRDCC